MECGSTELGRKPRGDREVRIKIIVITRYNVNHLNTILYKYPLKLIKIVLPKLKVQ